MNVPQEILLSQQDAAVMLPGNSISILLWQAADSSAEQQQILFPCRSAGGSCFNRQLLELGLCGAAPWQEECCHLLRKLDLSPSPQLTSRIPTGW